MIKRKHIEAIIFWLAISGAMVIEGIAMRILP